VQITRLTVVLRAQGRWVAALVNILVGCGIEIKRNVHEIKVHFDIKLWFLVAEAIVVSVHCGRRILRNASQSIKCQHDPISNLHETNIPFSS
jgi:hypothetical protein